MLCKLLAPRSLGRMSTLPAAFIGHGNPMTLLETNRVHQNAWRPCAEPWHTPRRAGPSPPSTVLSPHQLKVTAMARPRTMPHGLRRFPQALFRVRVPGPRAPRTRRGGGAAAARRLESARTTTAGGPRPRDDGRCWTHMFPTQNVPGCSSRQRRQPSSTRRVGAIVPSASRHLMWRAAMCSHLRGWILARGAATTGAERFDAAVTAAMNLDLRRSPLAATPTMRSPCHARPLLGPPTGGLAELQGALCRAGPRAVSSVASR